MRCSECEQPGQRVQRMDAGHVAYVALNLRLDEIAIPGSPPGRRAPRERCRVSAANDAFGKLRSEPICESRPEAAAKERFDEAWSPSLELALGERVQPQNADAAGERVRETRHEQDVGGARQDEPAGGPALVDGRLERREEFRGALNLIEDRSPRQPFHETDRVASGSVPDSLVVERHVTVAARFAHGAGQRRLAALTRPVNQNGRCVRQCLAQARGQVAWKRSRLAGHDTPILAPRTG